MILEPMTSAGKGKSRVTHEESPEGNQRKRKSDSRLIGCRETDWQLRALEVTFNGYFPQINRWMVT